METIKVSIDVNVNLSEATKNFLAGILSGSIAPVKPTPVAEPATPVKPKPAAEATAPVKPAAPQAKSGSTVTIEMIRAAVSAKAGTHRDQLRDKLTELGANRVTNLAPEHYEEFYSFINSLE